MRVGLGCERVVSIMLGSGLLFLFVAEACLWLRLGT